MTLLVAGVVLSAIFGYVLEWAFFSFLYQRDHLQQVLLTYGADPRLRGAAQPPGRQRRARRAVAGAGSPAAFRSATLMTYPVYRLFISAVCIALALGAVLRSSTARGSA